MTLTPDELAGRLETLAKEAFGGDWTMCVEEFGPHKGAVYVHAHDVDADGDGLPRDYGKRICDMADNDDDEANAELIAFAGNNARHIARLLRSQAERIEKLEGALKPFASASRDNIGVTSSSFVTREDGLRVSHLRAAEAALERP